MRNEIKGREREAKKIMTGKQKWKKIWKKREVSIL
jgi:hypothetical protein